MSWTSQLRKPILKSKPILKGKPVKKNMFTYTSPDGTISRLDQDVGVIHNKIKKKILQLGKISVQVYQEIK